MGSKINFLREFIKEPSSVGAVAPSGSVLASRMLDDISLDVMDIATEIKTVVGNRDLGACQWISIRLDFLRQIANLNLGATLI